MATVVTLEYKEYNSKGVMLSSIIILIIKRKEYRRHPVPDIIGRIA